ncbi:ABC transporter permease [Glycomyces albidus]|uniref:ABC transporter permease subunit n=1 Tax=Glycomyces albidus TaxID=2656774 RepID=A0A6L5GC94_9ACTN|nr:ABC transporter permease subunit [Glycomyces albidus]MQM27250.1 ABC transporter permease subunit [Glycomyces albidus]
MNLLADAFAWLFAPEQWTGPNALQHLLAQQLSFTATAVAIAALIAVPLGWAIGHTGRGREVAVAFSGAARAVPSFGLLVLLVLVFGVLRKPEAATVTFVILAIPSLLAGAYAGFEAIDRRVVDAARAVGMTGAQILWRVEIPLGLPLLVAGFRSAVLQVVATVTIAAYVNLGGLGLPIITGLSLRRYEVVLGGAILVALLALVLDALFALAQRAAVPHGIRADQGHPTGRRLDPEPAAPATPDTADTHP